jgi:hypothetical protein
MSSYQIAHASELAHAASAISEFAATATYELPRYITATSEYNSLIGLTTDVPVWFGELPVEVQNIKIQEGKDVVSILSSVFGTSASPVETSTLGSELHGFQNAGARDYFTVVTILVGVAVAVVMTL